MSEHDVRSLRYGRKRIHENSVLNISQISSTSSDSTQPVTRGLRSKHWLVGYPIEILTGAKLPTNLLVLRRYLSLRFDSALCKKKRDIAEEVLSELMNTFWLPSRIPTREKKHCIDIILKLATAYENLKKTPVARRETNACSKKIQIFLASLHSLCDLSPTNCYDILRQSGYDEWETDWNFLVGQRLTPQVGSMEGVDKILAAKEKKKMEREKLQENRLMNERIRLSKAEIEAEVIISEQSEIEDEENLDSDSSFEMIEKKKKQQTCSLQLPVKTLISESAAVAERFRISDRQLFAVTSSTIKLGGGKISDFSLSVSTTNRHRRQERRKVATEILESYVRPEFVACHWDSKLFHRCGGSKEDRIAIYVSSPTKLLAIPAIKRSTGLEQKAAVVQALTKWSLNDSVVALVYDTTASNTGQWQGAVALIETELQHPVLWVPCRHHISELHIKHTAIKVTGETKSPSVKLFQRFKEEWETLKPNECELQLFVWPSDKDCFLFKQAEFVKNWTEEHLSNNTFPREDYRELCELIAVYLGVTVPRGFLFRRPGADHHARFMSKAIYFMKISLLRDMFSLYGTEEAEVDRMAIYIGLFYGYYFLRSPLTASAPSNDLMFFSWMNDLKEIDKDVAETNLHSLNRHLDYLTEELVVFALFNSQTPSEEKNMMGKKLSMTPRPSVFLKGKPSPPTITVTAAKHNSLSHFIGPR